VSTGAVAFICGQCRNVLDGEHARCALCEKTACGGCICACVGCGKAICNECRGACGECTRPLCGACILKCDKCDKTLCAEDRLVCACGHGCCLNHAVGCGNGGCTNNACEDCWHICEDCDRVVCTKKCVVECAKCGERGCRHCNGLGPDADVLCPACQ
jgi:hypothetical protein